MRRHPQSKSGARSNGDGRLVKVYPDPKGRKPLAAILDLAVLKPCRKEHTEGWVPGSMLD
jgi:hypothetical protein